ncbi:hypothetical protein GE09DRAFT_1256561 [Coniochaeta sp. 2T2.1]|nr:hypothetical protein GE09DRAFT_1256561 [Coniochaeta sp. 2T2.1]
MRVRKLGQGQSVTFIVSPEMRKRIRVIRNTTNGRALTVRDVLAWAISKSWDEAARSVPLWATQGKRHLRQEEIWNQADDPGGFPNAAVKEYLEPEAMSLDQRYRPTDSTLTTPSSTLQEEQEREVAPEIEEERQVSRPPPRQALNHIIHPDVELYVLTGHIPPKTPAFINPFAPFSTTGAAALFPAPLSSFPSDLLVTRDFARTVDETGPGYVSDPYQRNVQWVLTSTDSDSGTRRMVVISPYEAAWAKSRFERLDGDSAPVTLHAYLARSSLKSNESSSRGDGDESFDLLADHLLSDNVEFTSVSQNLQDDSASGLRADESFAYDRFTLISAPATTTAATATTTPTSSSPNAPNSGDFCKEYDFVPVAQREET